MLHLNSYVALAAVVLLLAATAAPRLSTLLMAMPQAVGTQGGASFAVFDPANIKIADTATEAGICLKADPGLVKPTVFLEADGVRFDKCKLDFDSTNWNKHQKFKMYPKASFSAGATTSVLAARLAWEGNAEHGKTQSLTMARDVSTGRICQANGDPHYSSFDGRAFDFQGMNCYELLKSPGLVIQTRHAPWVGGPTAAIHIGMALAYGKTAFVVDCMQAADKRVQMLSPDSNGVDVFKNPGYTDIQFQMSDGAQAKLQIVDGGTPGCYMNIQVLVPAVYKSKTQGLCGIYDDNNANDFTTREGAVSGDPTAFGNSWQVKAEEDMFKLGYTAKIIAELQPQVTTEECKFPADLKGFGVAPPPLDYTPVAVAATPQPQILPLPPVPVAAAKGRDDAAFVAFVTALCTRVMVIPGLNKLTGIPTAETHIKDCVADCKLGGILDPVDNYRIAYQRLVYAHVSASMEKFKICEKTGRPRARSEAEIATEAERVGLGNFKCPTGEYDTAVCSGQGRCDTFGCACNKGFSMFDCSLNLAKEVVPPMPAAAVAVAPALPAAPVVVAAPVPAPVAAPPADYRRRR